MILVGFILLPTTFLNVRVDFRPLTDYKKVGAAECGAGSAKREGQGETCFSLPLTLCSPTAAAGGLSGGSLLLKVCPDPKGQRAYQKQAPLPAPSFPVWFSTPVLTKRYIYTHKSKKRPRRLFSARVIFSVFRKHSLTLSALRQAS